MPGSNVLWSVVEEHFDEVEYLIGSSASGFTSARRTLLRHQEADAKRLAAHLDALVLLGEPVRERVLIPAYDDVENTDRLVAAALVDLELCDSEKDFERLGQLAANPPVAEALISAFPWYSGRREIGLTGFLRRSREAWPLLLRLLAQRCLPPGKELVAGLEAEGPVLVAATLRLVRLAELEDAAVRTWVERQVRSDDVATALEAADTALMWASEAAWARLKALAAQGVASAMVRVAGLGSRAECEAIASQCSDPKTRRAALLALGYSGWRSSADVCLEFMADKDPRIARVAGEGFASITGIPLDDSDFWIDANRFGQAEEEDDLPPLERDLVTDLMPNDDDALPVPVGFSIKYWWRRHRSLFEPHVRHVLARPVDAPTMQWAMHEGCALRRLGYSADLMCLRARSLVWVPHPASPRRVRQCLDDLPAVVDMQRAVMGEARPRRVSSGLRQQS
ncbi:MAG: hypothetical protein JNG84_10330 [Archangium sp.]|nr:hypothetical protein [Archangium sp.]